MSPLFIILAAALVVGTSLTLVIMSAKKRRR